MNQLFAGRRVVVTAAAQGIGRATAIAFVASGAEVWAVDQNPVTLASLPAAPNLRSRVADLTEPRDIAAFVGELGVVDILINAVGVVAHGDLLSCSDDDWDRSWAVNVTTMFRMTRALLPRMLAAGGGVIVNISSVASTIKGVPQRCAYGTTKAAVIGLTKSIAADYVARGIRCNAICPGTVDSPSLRERMEATGDAAQARASFVARQPMGRLGTAEEIAAAALYLSSDAAAFTTGSILTVDGGMSL